LTPRSSRRSARPVIAQSTIAAVAMRPNVPTSRDSGFVLWHILSVECNPARRSVSKAEQKLLASPEAAGRTTIVGKKLVVILGQKKAVAVWPERVRVAAMVEAGGVSPPSCIVDSARNGTMLKVLHSGADGRYRGHNRLGPAR
jgi:hypothetical protein